MQGWIVAGAWLFAVLFAAVVLGFAGYEIRWKLRRLDADRGRLELVAAELGSVGAQLSEASARTRNPGSKPRSVGVE
jgi:hypothetical protein